MSGSNVCRREEVTTLLFQSQRMQIGGFLAIFAEFFGYLSPFFRGLRKGVGGGGFAFDGRLDGFIQRGKILLPAGQAKIEPRFAAQASRRSIRRIGPPPAAQVPFPSRVAAFRDAIF